MDAYALKGSVLKRAFMRALCVIGFFLSGVSAVSAADSMMPNFDGKTQPLCSFGYKTNELDLFWLCLDDSKKTISVVDGDIHYISQSEGSPTEFMMDGTLVELTAQPKLVTEIVERSKQCAISKGCQISKTAPEKARFFQDLDASTVYWEVDFAENYGFQSQKRNFLIDSSGEFVVLTSPLDKRYEGDNPVIIINSYFINP